MKTRIVAGVTAAILVTWLLFTGPQLSILLLTLLLSVMAYLEFDRLFFERPNFGRRSIPILFLLLVVTSISVSLEWGWVAMWLGLIALFIRHVFLPSRSGDFQSAVHDISIELLGMWYVVGLFSFVVPIINLEPLGRQYLFLLLLMVFVGDSAAYFVGKFFGRHSLAERVSPKKTVEGAIGAGVGCFLASLVWMKVVGHIDPSSTNGIRILLFSPVISALAQFGDLFESVLKRSQDKKDSGTFLPGHGGLLDRVDGLALSSPVFYFFIRYALEP